MHLQEEYTNGLYDTIHERIGKFYQIWLQQYLMLGIINIFVKKYLRGCTYVHSMSGWW